MAGLSIAGGLLKNVDQQTGAIEYLGMLLARFGVYGITIYGGYGEGVENGETFVASSRSGRWSVRSVARRRSS